MKMAESIAVSGLLGTQMFILLFSVYVFENFPIKYWKIIVPEGSFLDKIGENVLEIPSTLAIRINT